MALLVIFGSIVLLFVIFLIVKSLLPVKHREKLCVLCVAFCVSWLVLLVLWWLNMFSDVIILALLVGLSVLGVFYSWERRVRKQYLVFRLPVLLSLVFVAYSAIKKNADWNAIVFLIVLWVVFLFVFLYRTHTRFQGVVEKLIACCRDW